MLQTLLGMAPLTLVALVVGAWTAVDVVREIRAPREDVHGGDRRG